MVTPRAFFLASLQSERWRLPHVSNGILLVGNFTRLGERLDMSCHSNFANLRLVEPRKHLDALDVVDESLWRYRLHAVEFAIFRDRSDVKDIPLPLNAFHVRLLSVGR